MQFAGSSVAEGIEKCAEVIVVCLCCRRGQELYMDIDEASTIGSLLSLWLVFLVFLGVEVVKFWFLLVTFHLEFC